MAIRSAHPLSRQRRLSSPECRAWLADHHEGRLGYQSGRGPRCVVVSYALAGDQIMVRLPDYNDIVHYAPGSEIRLEVDGSIAEHRETVRVTGTARLADEPARPLVAAADFAESWPDGVQTSVVCLPLATLEGYED